MSAAEFDQLVLSNTEFLRPFALNHTNDREEAKDLFQETLLRALANREKYFAGTNIKAWLYTIMRNIFINQYRRQTKGAIVSDFSKKEFLMNNTSFSTSNEAIARLNQKAIEAAVHELPDIFRQPFMLYFEGYKYNEIAAMLNEPLGTVKSRIHFARKLLKTKAERN